jgi:IclR family transcriptional regulator, mhp operon transcriptional activator
MVDVKPIRAFERGLTVLAALNRHGSATALTLARDTGLPRATVYRTLKTLCAQGYSARSASDDRFTLLMKVRNLSEGFEDEQWLGSIAAPAMFELTRKVHWPCDVTTLDGMEMIIRETTHRFAPMSIDRDMMGRHLPLLKSSAGMAYLAFAPASERKLLLRLLRNAGQAVNFSSLEKESLETRERGFSFRQGGSLWPHTGSIAMPLRDGNRILGCIALIWMTKALSAKQGIALSLEPLRKTAEQIEGGLRARGST